MRQIENNTSPGIHPNVRLDRFTDAEQTIIHRLSKEWYITNDGHDIKIGRTSVYRYVLIKPTLAIVELFNIEREIILLLSPFENFEPRTLDAIEEAVEFHPGLRIERVCSVLVSRDYNIESKLVHLLRNDQESQIVVPFTYDELLTKDDPFFVRNRFKSYFYSRDLFDFQAPLKRDLFFFGMNNLVHDIVNRHLSGENSALFGLRRTGKTSVIFSIERTLDKKRELSVRIDCQDPAFHMRRWNEALWLVIQEIARKYDVASLQSAESEYTVKNAPIAFGRDITTLSKKLGKKRLLIIFDEIENITFGVSRTEHWRTGDDFVLFWQTLRSLFQKQGSLFSCLIVGTNTLCVETPIINGGDNPIFNQMPFTYIPRFSVSQTQDMLKTLGSIMGLVFDDVLFAKLTEDFGGHPFLIRQMASLMNKLVGSQRPAKVDRAMYAKARHQLLQEHQTYIEMILTVLQGYYKDEYDMMALLAMGDEQSFRDFALMSPSYTNHLLGYGLIEETSDGWDFKIAAVRDYIRQRTAYRPVEMSLTDKYGEIGEKRNALETRLRKLIRMQLQVCHGKADAKEKVLNICGGDRKLQGTALSYEDLFIGGKFDLYFDDLRKIVLKNYDCFKNVFDKNNSSFDQRMTIINKLRADAHANPITDEEFALLREAVTALETQISQFSD